MDLLLEAMNITAGTRPHSHYTCPPGLRPKNAKPTSGMADYRVLISHKEPVVSRHTSTPQANNNTQSMFVDTVLEDHTNIRSPRHP